MSSSAASTEKQLWRFYLLQSEVRQVVLYLQKDRIVAFFSFCVLIRRKKETFICQEKYWKPSHRSFFQGVRGGGGSK